MLLRHCCTGFEWLHSGAGEVPAGIDNTAPALRLYVQEEEEEDLFWDLAFLSHREALTSALEPEY